MTAVRARVYVKPTGRSPFLEQFRRLDRDAADLVVRRLRQELRALDSGQTHVGKKLESRDLWQISGARGHGAAIRVLFRRFGDHFVIIDVFTKSNNYDNDMAITRAEQYLGELQGGLRDDPTHMTDATDLLCLEHTTITKRPWRARPAADTDDIGVLQLGVTVRRIDETLKPSEDWLDARQTAEDERRDIVHESQIDDKLADETIARLAERAAEDARRRIEATARQEREQRQWSNPPFDLELLIDWIALDEEIEYLEEVGLEDEKQRNIEAAEQFEVNRQAELEALRIGEEDIKTNPKFADGRARDEEMESIGKELKEMIEQFVARDAEYKKESSQQRSGDFSREDSGRRQSKGSIGARPKFDPKAYKELQRKVRALQDRTRDYSQLYHITQRRKEVETDTFVPSHAAARRLVRAKEMREARMNAIGLSMLHSKYPAVAAAVLPERRTDHLSRKQRETQFSDRQKHVVAIWTRFAYEHGLGMVDRVGAGIDLELLVTDKVIDMIGSTARYQRQHNIPLGSGFDSDIAEVANDLRIALELQ